MYRRGRKIQFTQNKQSLRLETSDYIAMWAISTQNLLKWQAAVSSATIIIQSFIDHSILQIKLTPTPYLSNEIVAS